MKFYIVGSALSCEKPRDVDLYGVMDDLLFESYFRMNAEVFQYWRRIKLDSPPNSYISPYYSIWENHVLGATRVLQFVFPELVPLDFKFIPISLLQEPCKEVDITTSPRTWGIGLPNLGGGQD